MSQLKKQLDSDLKEFLKNKNMVAADALRMLKSRVKNEEIAKQKDFSDEEIEVLISSEMKRRKDSVEAYTQGGRPELAQKELSEFNILKKYLPEQFSDAEASRIIDEIIAGQNFGTAEGMVMPKLKGKAAGDQISKLLKEKLK